MKINKTVFLVMSLVLIALSALIVLSQIPASATDTNTFSTSKIVNINDKISLEEKQDCEIDYYNATEDVYGYVTRTRDTYGTCFNPANQSYHTCINSSEPYQNYEYLGTKTVLKNTTTCHSKSFTVSVNKGALIEKKEIDFYSWGVCVQSTENGCLAITCGTLKGGSARNGIFNGCDGGKSCQKFLFCDDGTTKVLYKASREGFTEEDPTFYLSKLEVKEVGR